MAKIMRAYTGLVAEGMTRPNSLVVLVRRPWAVESGTYPICAARALILALVAADTSGSSRRALETVITETPVSWAMSFNRTMVRR